MTDFYTSASSAYRNIPIKTQLSSPHDSVYDHMSAQIKYLPERFLKTTMVLVMHTTDCQPVGICPIELVVRLKVIEVESSEIKKNH